MGLMFNSWKEYSKVFPEEDVKVIKFKNVITEELQGMIEGFLLPLLL